MTHHDVTAKCAPRFVRVAALALISFALFWSGLIAIFAVLSALSAIRDGESAAPIAAFLLIFLGLPMAFAATALAGAIRRADGPLWSGSFLYLLTILEPGLGGIYYAVSIVAILSGAALTIADRPAGSVAWGVPWFARMLALLGAASIFGACAQLLLSSEGLSDDLLQVLFITLPVLSIPVILALIAAVGLSKPGRAVAFMSVFLLGLIGFVLIAWIPPTAFVMLGGAAVLFVACLTPPRRALPA